MIKIILLIGMLTAIFLPHPTLIFAETDHGSTTNRLLGTTTDAISDFVRTELDLQSNKVKGLVLGKVKSFFSRLGSFIKEKIGVNLYEGAKLFGQFLLWLFEALANLVRWLLSFF